MVYKGEGYKYLKDLLFQEKLKSEKKRKQNMRLHSSAVIHSHCSHGQNMTIALVPKKTDNQSGFKPSYPPASDSGSASVYLKALCLESPSKHWSC